MSRQRLPKQHRTIHCIGTPSSKQNAALLPLGSSGPRQVSILPTPLGSPDTLHSASTHLMIFQHRMLNCCKEIKIAERLPKMSQQSQHFTLNSFHNTTGGSDSETIQQIGAPAFSSSLRHENLVLHASFVTNAFFQLHPSPSPATPQSHGCPTEPPPSSPSAPRSKDGSSTQPNPSAGSSSAFLNTRSPQDTANDFFHLKISRPMLC